MNQFEPLYTKEDLIHDALVMSANKGISLEKATYFARMKRGRESISLARGFEATIEELPSSAEPAVLTESLLYLAICEELTTRNLDSTVLYYSSHDTNFA